MKLYNTSEVFEINEELDCDLIKEEWGSYIRVKNFWKNPEKVREVFLNSPCHPLSGACYATENGTKYFDGRNEICFMDQPQFSNVVFYIICKYFNIDNRFLDLKWKLPTILFGNVFQMYDRNSNPFDTHYYAPHRDGLNQIACTWYMNENYVDGEGTSIYDKSISETEECYLNIIDSPWTKSVERVGHIQAEYNSLVIYDGSIPHGQSITERWFSEPRLSLVQFFIDKRVYK